MVNKYQAGGAVVGLFLPIIADVVGGGLVWKLAKKKNTKDFGKGLTVMGVGGFVLISAMVAAGVMPVYQVTVYKAVLY